MGMVKAHSCVHVAPRRVTVLSFVLCTHLISLSISADFVAMSRRIFVGARRTFASRVMQCKWGVNTSTVFLWKSCLGTVVREMGRASLGCLILLSTRSSVLDA